VNANRLPVEDTDEALALVTVVVRSLTRRAARGDIAPTDDLVRPDRRFGSSP